MTSTTKLFCLICFLIIATAVVLVFKSWGVGGMPPTYNAKNYDAELTRVAQGAVPFITALKQYKQENGGYPKDLLSIVSRLPKDVAVHQQDPSQMNSWRYSLSVDGKEFMLVTKLGWDPVLIYRDNELGNEWVFEPGDGSQQKKIILNP